MQLDMNGAKVHQVGLHGFAKLHFRLHTMTMAKKDIICTQHKKEFIKCIINSAKSFRKDNTEFL